MPGVHVNAGHRKRMEDERIAGSAGCQVGFIESRRHRERVLGLSNDREESPIIVSEVPTANNADLGTNQHTDGHFENTAVDGRAWGAISGQRDDRRFISSSNSRGGETEGVTEGKGLIAVRGGSGSTQLEGRGVRDAGNSRSCWNTGSRHSHSCLDAGRGIHRHRRIGVDGVTRRVSERPCGVVVVQPKCSLVSEGHLGQVTLVDSRRHVGSPYGTSSANITTSI